MATAKKAATQPQTIKFDWVAMLATYDQALLDENGWDIGKHASLAAAVNSPEFAQFMIENEYPEKVYIFSMTKGGKPNTWHRILVKRGGYTVKEG